MNTTQEATQFSLLAARILLGLLLGVAVSLAASACTSSRDHQGAGTGGSIAGPAGGNGGAAGNAGASGAARGGAGAYSGATAAASGGRSGGPAGSSGQPEPGVGGQGQDGAIGGQSGGLPRDSGQAEPGTGGQGQDAAIAGSGGQAGAVAGSGGQAGAGLEPGPLFPPNNAQGLCPDPQLHMRFSGPPSVGDWGKIQVFSAEAPGSPVAVVDLAVPTVNETIGGRAFDLPRPVLVNGNEVIVRLPPHSLGYGQTYSVTVDSGAVQGPDGESIAFGAGQDWQFATLPAPPDDLTELRVALDGTGQFCSVQGALDALATGNSAASTITIGEGTYFEIIHVTSKNNVTLRGEDRKATRIAGVNNNNLNPSTAARSLVGIDRSSGIVVENLTIHNLTPQDGSQAEALRMQDCDQCVVRHADIKSLQDTLLWSGRIYANDCIIEGNVDFVWGTGVAFFDHCEIKTVGRRGCIVQARNDASGYGYVFVDSKLTADPGITGQILARIDATFYPASHVAFVNCQMTGIAPEGWSVTGLSLGGSLRFWEYQSTDASGTPIDVNGRIASSRQISADEAARMRDPAHVLGGWTPPR